MASGPRAMVHEDDDDYMVSPPGLWLPRMVVKQNRRKATIIWAVLLTGFLTYLSYVVWETIRKDPAASIELKQGHYKFPDVMLCPNFLIGCQTRSKCAKEPDILFLSGFEDDYKTFMDDHAHEVVEIEETYNLCEVIPLSRLTPNDTAINNGDIKAFSVRFVMLWEEELEEEFAEFTFNNQYVTLHFIDIDNDINEIGGDIVDAVVPYARVNVTTGIPFVAMINHMVMELTEFTGLNGNGNQEESRRTFSQSMTTAPQNWVFEDEGFNGNVLSFLSVEMSIEKFEYTSIEEIDPVDVWVILGAIGGIWQLLVTGFGLFFVFSEKQAPDRKLRNFRKSVAKPVHFVSRRVSTGHQTTANTDVEIDASDEDLPVEWVKRQQPTGSIYYFNCVTGVKQGRSPNDVDHAVEGSPDISRGSTVSRMFMLHDPAVADSPLPPGWGRGTDANGRLYYLDTIRKTTQWERPTRPLHSTDGRDERPQVFDAPMVHMRRSVRAHPFSSSGGPTRRHSTATKVSAASSPPDADAQTLPLGSTPATPSNRMVTRLSNSSATTAAPAGDAHLPGSLQQMEAALEALTAKFKSEIFKYAAEMESLKGKRAKFEERPPSRGELGGSVDAARDTNRQTVTSGELHVIEDHVEVISRETGHLGARVAALEEQLRGLRGPRGNVGGSHFAQQSEAFFLEPQEGRGRKTTRTEGGNSAFGTQTSREDTVTDPRGPPTNVLLEPSWAEKEAEIPPEADVDMIRGSEPTESAIAGDEWEVLAETLQAGEKYLSKDGGVCLSVQRGSLGDPGPGPVRLHFSTQLLRCRGQDYLSTTIVHCPPNNQFEQPLLLDFFLDDPAISNGKQALKQVLKRYQILRLNYGETEWQPLERRDIVLVEDRGAIYLRAQLRHFTLFSYCMKCDPTCGITWTSHKDKRAVMVHNDSDQRLLLVVLPTKYVAVCDKRHAVQFEVGGAGAEVGGTFGRQKRTEYVWLPQGEAPSSQEVRPRAKAQRLRLGDVKCSERLIICSTTFVREESFTTQATPSQASPGQIAPAETVPSGQGEYRLVKFYEDPKVQGGDGLVIHQCRLDDPPQNECYVRAKGVDLKHVAMVLAGLSGGSQEGKANRGEKGGQDETEKPIGKWYPRFLR